MSLDFTDQQQVVDLLRNNYSCLQRQYRLGLFEGHITCARKWLGPDSGDSGDGFCELTTEPSVGGVSILFYELIKYAEVQRPGVRERQAALLLKSKSLIYEAKDYTVTVPAKLSEEFVEMADRFMHSTRASEMERWAEELNGAPFVTENPKDERTKVIKNLLIASLLGANHYYRLAEPASSAGRCPKRPRDKKGDRRDPMSLKIPPPQVKPTAPPKPLASQAPKPTSRPAKPSNASPPAGRAAGPKPLPALNLLRAARKSAQPAVTTRRLKTARAKVPPVRQPRTAKSRTTAAPTVSVARKRAQRPLPRNRNSQTYKQLVARKGVEAVRQKFYRMDFIPLEDSFEDLYARLVIFPFADGSESEPSDELCRELARLNHDTPQLKFALDEAGDLALLTDIPVARLNEDGLQAAVRVMVDYLNYYYAPLSALRWTRLRNELSPPQRGQMHQPQEILQRHCGDDKLRRVLVLPVMHCEGASGFRL